MIFFWIFVVPNQIPHLPLTGLTIILIFMAFFLSVRTKLLITLRDCGPCTRPWMGETFWFSCQVAYRSPSVCRLRKKKFRPPPLPKPMPDRVIFWAPPISHENHEKWNFQGLKSCKIIYVVGFQKLSTKVSMFFFGGVGKSVWVTKQTTRNTARKIFCQ